MLKEVHCYVCTSFELYMENNIIILLQLGFGPEQFFRWKKLLCLNLTISLLLDLENKPIFVLKLKNCQL